jgi:uncharacterized protein YdbL (DUF1318 family)
MIDIADKIYAATGLTLGAEEAAAIERLIQAENEKLRAALNKLLQENRVMEKKIEKAAAIIINARAALGEKE